MILEHDITIGNVRPHGVTGDFSRADAREVGFDFRDFQHRFFQLKLHIQRLCETGTRYSQRLDGNIALIQIRDKFRTHPRGQCADQNHKDQGRRQYEYAKFECPRQNRGVKPFGVANNEIVLLLNMPRHKQRHGGRHKGE